ncbi:MAG: DNA-directed RNA polymerase subunit omega [Candidatus Omnitrophica bacterium]|nr:DNA-directed RNA polymerase subunit omega [Candidatus Omnitrophota bacterium]
MAKTHHISRERLLGASGGSAYTLTILAAKRAMQLADGEKPLLDKPGEKVLENALREIEAGKIAIAAAVQRAAETPDSE